MELLDGTILRDPYDVIVVGAGLGGLTAGALLAKRGMSVLMIDQQHKPGGSCTSYKKEDHVFDVGTAMIYGFGDQGFRPFHFLLNELEEPIDVVAHKTLARMTFEGQEIVFWPDLERYLQELDRLFPEEQQALRLFHRDLYKMYEHIVIKNQVIVPPSEFSPRQGLRSLLSDPLAVLSMQKLLSTSVLDLLQKYFKTPGIIDFFDKLCSAYTYTTAAETPAVLAATMFIDNHVGGVYFPAGGAQMLPNTLERAIERRGGQMLYSQLVDEILIERGRACGVRLANGTIIRARRVLANATVWNLYGKLVKREHIPPERYAWARSLVPTFPSMTLYMVVDAQALPPGTYPWEIFIENRKLIDSTDLTLYINSLADATLCPPGHHVVMAISPNLRPWPSPADPSYRTEQYEAQKQEEALKMLDQIEQHLPGFSKAILSIQVGTPTTIERFLLKNGGAVGGPKNQIGQEMLKRLHARTEWKGLYACGDSTVMGTGAPATTVSGIGAANVILRDAHRPDYDVRAFPGNVIRFVEQPYTRPPFGDGEEITPDNAHLAAAQCQGCLEPDCVQGCPAAIDIPGFLRRMEAGNFAGAARLVREKNPFGEACGVLCAADRLCQKDCYRRSFTGKPVRIADLQAWVCASAGSEGWNPVPKDPRGAPVAVLGSGPAALTCAYYLHAAGLGVTLYTEDDPAEGILQHKLGGTPEAGAALARDLQGILDSGLPIERLSQPLDRPGLARLAEKARAVAMPVAGSEGGIGARLVPEGWNGPQRPEAVKHPELPGVFLAREFPGRGFSLVDAAASGRALAMAVWDAVQDS